MWQYILHSQGKERLPSFAELAGTSPSGSGLPAGAALSAATQAAAATMKHGQQQHTQQAAQGKTIGAAELQKVRGLYGAGGWGGGLCARAHYVPEPNGGTGLLAGLAELVSGTWHDRCAMGSATTPLLLTHQHADNRCLLGCTPYCNHGHCLSHTCSTST